MGSQNSIEINGKKYDALTGKLVQSSPGNSTPQKVSTITPNNGGVVDGFVRPPRKSSHQSTVHTVAKNPQKSQTLMRKSVHKPSTFSAPKSQTKPGVLKSKLGVSPQRAQAAQEIKRSPQIHKYGQDIARSSVIRKHPSSVKTEPAHTKPVTQKNIMQSPPLPQKAHRSLASQKLIESALANANSHSEPETIYKIKKRSRLARKLGISTKVLAISGASLAVVLLVGFFAVQNVPNVSMKVASARAGFDARMPGYRPSGFSFKGPINYSPGEVKVAYSSNSDAREFEIVQRNSNWNSDALLSNYVVAEGKQYQTYLDRGRTLYIYDGSNATWVDNGVWYQIEGDSNMTTDQLIRIASSI